MAFGSHACERARRAVRERVAAKFVEAEFEKADRLLELFFRYEASTQRVLRALRLLRDDELADGQAELLLREAGQFVVQQARLSARCNVGG